MLFFVLGIVLAVITFIFYYLSKKEKFEEIEEFLTGSFCVSIFISVLYFLVLFISFGNAVYSNKLVYEKLEQTYSGLTYKIEALNNGFADEFGINNNDIVNEVVSYNKSVTEYQYANKSLWTNWFICDNMDNLRLIEYDMISFNKN